MRPEQRILTPIVDAQYGAVHPDVQKKVNEAYAWELWRNKRTGDVNGAGKAWGFTGTVLGILGELGAIALGPYFPAAKVALAATKALSRVAWEVGAGVMTFFKGKEFINSNSRNRMWGRGASGLFRNPKPQPVAA